MGERLSFGKTENKFSAIDINSVGVLVDVSSKFT